MIFDERETSGEASSALVWGKSHELILARGFKLGYGARTKRHKMSITMMGSQTVERVCDPSICAVKLCHEHGSIRSCICECGAVHSTEMEQMTLINMDS